MNFIRMFFFLIFSWLQFVAAVVQKETTITASTAASNGASIVYDPNAVIVNASGWNINVPYQESDYDLKLSLNRSWAFTELLPSTLTIDIAGSTPFPLNDCDLIIVFAVGDSQYFSFTLHLDAKNNIKSHLFTFLTPEAFPNARAVSAIMAHDISHDRWNRVSRNDSWERISWNKQAIWPLTFKVINDPINGQATFQVFHDTPTERAVSLTFSSSFWPHEAIDFYLLGDSVFEQYLVSAVTVTKEHDITTAVPTADTFAPSTTPTKSPSTIPSASPTKLPSTSPSLMPSRTPSLSPSHFPSRSPSRSPSNIPTPSPTPLPSVVPTNSPSKPPSRIPTHFPSTSPSKMPSEMPSPSPTDRPTPYPTNRPTKQPTAPTTSPTNRPTPYPTDRPTTGVTTSTSWTTLLSTSTTEATTAKPSTIPTLSPSTAPTTAPTTFASVPRPTIISSTNNKVGATLVPTTTATKGEIVSFEVIITVTFQYTFSNNETNQIVLILAEMYRNILSCPDQIHAELFKAKVDYDHQSTIINASITPCNASVDKSTVDDQVDELVDNIQNQTGHKIDPQRTDIDIREIIDWPEPGESATNREELFQSDIVLWMVRIIGAQLALCCVLSFCVYFLRRRTRRLSKAKDEIIRAVRERRGEIKTDSSPLPSSPISEYNADPHQMLMYPNNDSLTDSNGVGHEVLNDEDAEDQEVTTPSSRSAIPFDDQIDSEMMMLNHNQGIWSHLKRGFANQRGRIRRVHTIVSDNSYPSIPHDTPRREGRKSESTNLRENQPLTLGVTGSPTLLSFGDLF